MDSGVTSVDKKIKLKKNDQYEIWVATLVAAKMVVDFLTKQEHDLKLGSETGGIPEWDDIVIQTSGGTYRHLQVKRYETDFCTKSCERGIKSRGENKGQPQDLSPFDRLFVPLAEGTAAGAEAGPNREYRIVLLRNNVAIKNGIEVRHLRDLAHDCQRPASTPEAIEGRWGTSKDGRNLFNWLRTWCGFEDWAHIHRALKWLTVDERGTEEAIKEDVETLLSHCFKNLDDVIPRIRTILIDEATAPGPLTPGLLLRMLKGHLSPTCERWTSYHRDSMEHWIVAGTHGSMIEATCQSEAVVRELWEGTGRSTLQIQSDWYPGQSDLHLPTELARLGLHIRSLGHVLLKNPNGWRAGIRHLAGDTLGLGESGNFESATQAWGELVTPPTTCSARTLTSFSEEEDECRSLGRAMDDLLSGAIVRKVRSKIREVENVEDRDTLERLWKKWAEALNADVPERRRFLKGMVQPDAERVCGELRLGPRTEGLLVHGFMMLLYVVAGLKGEVDWRDVGTDTRVIAIKTWGGPAGISPRERLIREGCAELLSHQQEQILILSGTETPESYLRDESLAHGSVSSDGLMDPKKPPLLITDSLGTDRWLKNGIEGFGRFLRQKLRDQEETRQKKIESL